MDTEMTLDNVEHHDKVDMDSDLDRQLTPLSEQGSQDGKDPHRDTVPGVRGSVRARRKSDFQESKEKSTFVDAAAMKEKVREKLCRPKYNVFDFYHEDGCAQKIAKSGIFDKTTLAIIAFNAIWIAIDTDMNDAAILLDADPMFVAAENFFCLYFTFEWIVRFLAFRRKRDGLKDGWFVFDSIMVSMMVLETWVFTIIILVFVPDAGGAGGGNAGILRLARLMRLSRMARMGKLLRVMPELLIMIKGMKAATRSVFFTLVLLVVILYIFAIALAQLADGTAAGDMYFSGVPASMYTLLVHGIFLDSIGTLTDSLGSEPVIAIIFLLFVLLGSLTVMNMLIGVLCEVVSAVAETEKEEMLVGYVHEKISRVMTLLDTDGGGAISKKEFNQILENDEAVRCLSDVGVDVFALIDLTDYIFESDDRDSDEIQLDFARFMEVVLQLRGTNTATVKDIVDLRKFMRVMMQDNYKLTAQILTKLDEGAQDRETLSRKLSEAIPTDTTGTGGRFRSQAVTKSQSLSAMSFSALGHYGEVNKHSSTSRPDSEFDLGAPPAWPHATPSGQLLSCDPLGIPDPAEFAPSQFQQHGEFSLMGQWESLGPEKSEPLLPRAPAVPWGEAYASPGNNSLMVAMDNGLKIPKFPVHVAETGDFHDPELSRALESQFESLCGQLATGLIDAMSMSRRSAEKSYARKLDDLHKDKGRSIEL